jgi:hypothetical protein
MRRSNRLLVLGGLALMLLAFPLAAAADHATRPHTPNIHAKGHSPDFGSFLVPDGQRDANSASRACTSSISRTSRIRSSSERSS